MTTKGSRMNDTQTDDEREALALLIDPNALELHAYPFPLNAADRVLAAGFKRAQGEPSDAQYPEVDAFAERMRAEMVANAGKGDRWREMSLWQAWCEISWHIGKMTGAIKADDIALIRELAADVANGALMLDEIARATGGGR